MQFFDEMQTASALPFDRLINAVEQKFIEGCEVPLRHNHPIQGASPEQSGILLLMPAWQPGKWLGVKTVSIFPHNKNAGLPGLHSVYILYDAATGKPAAIFDGDVITSRRTAAASALAARYLSRPDASALAVVGAGRVASLLADAYRAVRSIETVYVWNPTPEAGIRLAETLSAAGYRAEFTDDLEAAVRRADIVSCATLSTAPLVRGEWLQPGVHLDLIGSFTPAMRESDSACFQKGTVFVDTEEALMKAGDLLAAISDGLFQKEQLAATLQDLCRGTHPGRLNAEEITVFKSVGTALEDIAAAVLAYQTLNPGR